MTQIAVAAGIVPITLQFEGVEPAANLLTNNEIEIDYPDVDAAVNEANKLLSDEGYRMARRAEMLGAIITPKQFSLRLEEIMNGARGGFSLARAETPNDSEFKEKYLIRKPGKFDLERLDFSKYDLRHKTILRPQAILAAAYALLNKIKKH